MIVMMGWKETIVPIGLYNSSISQFSLCRDKKNKKKKKIIK